ncbi:MAG: FAD-dependent monooxygenase [Burkholderiaceae bacterium]
MNSRAEAARPANAALPTSIVDVAVIGGGIVGAASALGAAHAGLATIWVAGRDHPPSEGATSKTDFDARVYALSPSTRRFLETLRIWPQLDSSRIAPVYDMRVYGDREARAALHFGAYEAAIERLATIVEHRELSRVLDAAASYFPGITRIEGFASQVTIADEYASIKTDGGISHARLVIAADGAQSPTRAAFAVTTATKPYDQRAVVGNFACARAHAGTAFQWFTDEGVVALLPLPDIDGRHAVSLVWSAPDAIAEELMRGGSIAVAARLSAFVASQSAHATGPALGPLEALDPLVSIPLTMQFAHRMIAPRGALVGDAAHVVHPLAGQGLNLGLQDVEVLLDILTARESFRDCGDPVLLRRYERARAEPVFAMRQMTDGLARLFASEHASVARLRTLGMRVVDRMPPLKRLLIGQASGNP